MNRGDCVLGTEIRNTSGKNFWDTISKNAQDLSSCCKDLSSFARF